MKICIYIVWFLILACIAVAGYGTAIWYCLIGGIVQVVDAIKTTPTDSWGIAYGLARFLCTGIVAAMTTVGLFFFSGFWLVSIAPRFRRRW